MGCAVIPSGFLGAASDTRELLGGEGRRALPAALPGLTGHRPLTPAFAQRLSTWNKLSSWWPIPPSSTDSPSLPQLVFPPRKGYLE